MDVGIGYGDFIPDLGVRTEYLRCIRQSKKWRPPVLDHRGSYVIDSAVSTLLAGFQAYRVSGSRTRQAVTKRMAENCSVNVQLEW